MNGIVDCSGKQKTLQMSSGHKKHAWLLGGCPACTLDRTNLQATKGKAGLYNMKQGPRIPRITRWQGSGCQHCMENLQR